MDEKEQKRAEWLHHREQFIRLVDSFSEDNINLACALMEGSPELEHTFRQVFHPLLEAVKGYWSEGYCVALQEIRVKLELNGHYDTNRTDAHRFWQRFYSYYAQQGRIDNVLHWIMRWHTKFYSYFDEVETGELLQDIFFRSELKDLHIKNIKLVSPPAPNWNIAVAERHLAELRELYIENSADWLAYLAPHFAAMPLLQKLTLKNCNLSDLPQSVALLPKLTDIILDNNNFAQLPEVLNDCKALEKITIRYNQLTRLPDWLWELKQIKQLTISYNPMPVLSEHIFTMPHLWWLEMAGNGIKNLPIQKENTEITWLDIDNNPIGELPENFVYLTKLKILKAQNCQITQFPDWFSKFTDLQYLDLTDNLFTSIPASLNQLKEFNTLHAKNTPITQLPDLSNSAINFVSISSNLMPADLVAQIHTYFPKYCGING